MAQVFTRNNHTPQRITAENVAVSVPLASNTTLLDMVTEGCDKLSVQIDNTVQALDAFVVQGRVHRDASYITIASVAGDYSTPVGRMLRVTGAPVTLAAGASASFDMDVSGLYSVQILASGGNATDSVVSIYAAGGTAAGTPAANINATLTAGDIEVGAVEIKNDSDDTRAKVGGGVEANALRVTIASDSTGVVSVDDNGASLTVDNAALSVTGGGVEANALRVTLASDSTGVVSVDDNGGAITVDWNGTAPPIGAGTEATALRVTLATDSTGVVSVDDNGGALTVDIASGGIASGAVASGAFASGSISDGANVTLGAKADAKSAATDTTAVTAMQVLKEMSFMLQNAMTGSYETVAASQTAQALGATGATGDYINGVLVIPATTSPGAVTLLDNATSITIFTGGASSVTGLTPFFIPIGATSVSGAWKLTTGTSVSCIGVGRFT